MWNLCCSDAKYVAIAAPRGSSKTSAISLSNTLAQVLFGVHDYVLIVSNTERQAAQFLGNIKAELLENQLLIDTFGVAKIVKDTETDIIFKLKNGHQFRITVRGSGQEVRGLIWRGKRPNLIIIDDGESAEIVMNQDRRKKFSDWVFNDLLPCGSDTCKYRWVGTILHIDSMLNNLLANPEWETLRFAAHKSISDFSELLWPEKYPEERLRTIKNNYKSVNNLEGYSQEYLNNPVPEGATYLRAEDFIPMSTDDYSSHKRYFAAADFAISEGNRADYTVICVAGMDSSGLLHFVDVRRGRWDADEIISELLSVQKRYQPEIFTFEKGQIEKSIKPALKREMIRTGTYININGEVPSKSKTERGRSIQKVMKAGGCRFDTTASWYPDFYDELMTMTPAGALGKHDDQFDAFAYIGLTIDRYHEAETQEELEEIQYQDELEQSEYLYGDRGCTGYG